MEVYFRAQPKILESYGGEAMKVNAFFVECFLLRGRLSITAALFCLVAIIYSALTFPEGTQLGSFIVGVFVFLEIFKELGRNEGVLDCADCWLAIGSGAIDA